MITPLVFVNVLRNIANKHNLKLVHDSADTLGGSLRGKKTATRADISITSFSIYHIREWRDGHL